jgi:hypothetical protein
VRDVENGSEARVPASPSHSIPSAARMGCPGPTMDGATALRLASGRFWAIVRPCPLIAASRRPGLSRSWTPALWCATPAGKSSAISYEEEPGRRSAATLLTNGLLRTSRIRLSCCGSPKSKGRTRARGNCLDERCAICGCVEPLGEYTRTTKQVRSHATEYHFVVCYD